MRPSLVLHVLGGATGGAARSTLELMRQLARHGVRAAAVSADFGEDAVRAELAELTEGRVSYQPLYWWNEKVRVARWKRPLVEARQAARTGWGRGSAARVAAQAPRWRADLLHTNTSLTPEGGRAARWLHLPHVWHVRELIGPDQPFRFPLEGAALGRYFAARASYVVANSHRTAALLAPYLPPDRLEVVPNGLDLTGFAAPAAARSGPLVVAMVASLSARVKKHALFVAMARALPPGLPVELRIYGDVPAGDTYAAEVAAAARDAGVELMGHRADPRAIMAEIDVLVQPSDQDSFGRVAVEAMAAGRAVLGVSGGGVSEIVEDGVSGLLARADDPRDLAAKLTALAADAALRARLGEAGRARAHQRYSIEACAARVLEVYEAAMRRPLSWRERS